MQGHGPGSQPTSLPRRTATTTVPARATRNFKKPQTDGRVFCLEVEEEEKEPNEEGKESKDLHTVVTGTLLVNHVFYQVLFDYGAMHSFINPVIAKRLTCKSDDMDVQLCIATPLGSIYQTDIMFRNCPVTTHGRIFRADLILLDV